MNQRIRDAFWAGFTKRAENLGDVDLSGVLSARKYLDPILGTLVGGGLGAGAGYLFSSKKNKSRNALLGGLAGGGLGLAHGISFPSQTVSMRDVLQQEYGGAEKLNKILADVTKAREHAGGNPFLQNIADLDKRISFINTKGGFATPISDRLRMLIPSHIVSRQAAGIPGVAGFVNSLRGSEAFTNTYNPQEWSTVLSHEGRHTTQTLPHGPDAWLKGMAEKLNNATSGKTIGTGEGMGDYVFDPKEFEVRVARLKPILSRLGVDTSNPSAIQKYLTSNPKIWEKDFRTVTRWGFGGKSTKEDVPLPFDIQQLHLIQDEKTKDFEEVIKGMAKRMPLMVSNDAPAAVGKMASETSEYDPIREHQIKQLAPFVLRRMMAKDDSRTPYVAQTLAGPIAAAAAPFSMLAPFAGITGGPSIGRYAYARNMGSTPEERYEAIREVMRNRKVMKKDPALKSLPARLGDALFSKKRIPAALTGGVIGGLSGNFLSHFWNFMGRTGKEDGLAPLPEANTTLTTALSGLLGAGVGALSSHYKEHEIDRQANQDAMDSLRNKRLLKDVELHIANHPVTTSLQGW